jgi:TIR domain
MRVFITWSGGLSRQLAETLRQWLPAVVQAVKPYFSPDDVTKGARWNTEIAKELEASKIGLICLTPDNQDAPWVMFEAGALSRNLDRSKVCPLLFGLEPTDVKGPLVQFQSSKFSQEEMKRVVRMINAELSEQALAADVLDSVFTMWWPKLEKQVNEILAAKPGGRAAARSERDMIEEVLAISRSMAHQSAADTINPAAVQDLVQCFDQLREACGETPPDAVKEAIERLVGPVRYIENKLLVGAPREGVPRGIAHRLMRRARFAPPSESAPPRPPAEGA